MSWDAFGIISGAFGRVAQHGVGFRNGDEARCGGGVVRVEVRVMGFGEVVKLLLDCSGGGGWVKAQGLVMIRNFGETGGCGVEFEGLRAAE